MEENIAREFHKECQERKRTGRGARNRKCGSKTKYVHFRQDDMTQKEINAMHGEVVTYKMGDPIKWGEFSRMPGDLTDEYLRSMVKRFNVKQKMLAEAFHVSPVTLSKQIKDNGGTFKFPRGGARLSEAEEIVFWRWWNGEDKQELPEPMEQLNLDDADTKSVSKYQVGDRVLVRSDLVANTQHKNCITTQPITKAMAALAGQVVTIQRVFNGDYFIKEGINLWTDDLFVGLAEEVAAPVAETVESTTKSATEADNESAVNPADGSLLVRGMIKTFNDMTKTEDSEKIDEAEKAQVVEAEDVVIGTPAPIVPKEIAKVIETISEPRPVFAMNDITACFSGVFDPGAFASKLGRIVEYGQKVKMTITCEFL